MVELCDGAMAEAQNRRMSELTNFKSDPIRESNDTVVTKNQDKVNADRVNYNGENNMFISFDIMPLKPDSPFLSTDILKSMSDDSFDAIEKIKQTDLCIHFSKLNEYLEKCNICKLDPTKLKEHYLNLHRDNEGHYYVIVNYVDKTFDLLKIPPHVVNG